MVGLVKFRRYGLLPALWGPDCFMNDGDKPVDRTRRVLIGLCLLAAIALIIAFAISQQPSVSLGPKEPAVVLQQVRTMAVPRVELEDGYAGADSCRECHEHHYDTWYNSYHRTMTQVATRQTSAASFDDVEIEFANPYREQLPPIQAARRTV